MLDPLNFDVRIHPLPAECQRVACSHGGRELERLDFSPEQFQHQFACTFEACGEVLNRFDQLFLEPDGSFVWRGKSQPDLAMHDWQLDGHLFDRKQRLLFMELAGNCPQAIWEQFRDAVEQLGERKLMYEWVREGLYTDETSFLILAAGE